MKVYNVIKTIDLKGKYVYHVISCNIWEIIKINFNFRCPISSIKNIFKYFPNNNIYFSKKKAQKEANKLNNEKF